MGVYLLHTQYVKAKQSETSNQMYWMKQMLTQCHKVTCAQSSYGQKKSCMLNSATP